LIVALANTDKMGQGGKIRVPGYFAIAEFFQISEEIADDSFVFLGATSDTSMNKLGKLF
jgi:hypothetical protein